MISFLPHPHPFLPIPHRAGTQCYPDWGEATDDQCSSLLLRTSALPPLDWPLPSQYEQLELRIEVQPRAHHRAHYETEGSRGAVKAAPGGHPLVKVRGRGQKVCNSLSPPWSQIPADGLQLCRPMALPFPTLPLSNDPAGSLEEGLELGEEGCTSRTQIHFLLLCPPTILRPHSSHGVSTSCLLWWLARCGGGVRLRPKFTGR